MPKPHHQLVVWKRAIGLVKQVYLATTVYPSEEKFGLVSQMRRAAVSIPSNIAEGAARNTTREFENFLHIAQGSAAELETQIISRELEFLLPDRTDWLLNELDEISRMIIGLHRKLKSSRREQ
jgi:four helix bundle protein